MEGDLKADRTSVKAFTRIGDLCVLKGANAEAEKSYQQAIELGRVLLENQPDNALAKRELAKVLSRLSAYYLRTGSQPSEAPLDEATELLQQVVMEDPDDFDALVEMVVLHDLQLKRIRMNAPMEPQRVIDYGESILGDVERLFELSDHSQRACEAAQAIHFCIGRGYLESYQAKKAAEHFAAARPYLDRALSQAPRNVALQAASAVLDRAHGMALASDAQLAPSIVLFEKALETLTKLANEDPDDVNQKQNIANTQIIISTAYDRMGRFDDADQVLNSAIDTYQTLIESGASDVARILKIQAEFQLAMMQMYQEQFSECRVVCDSIQQEIKRKSFAAPYQASVKYFGDGAAIMLEAVNWLTGSPPVEKTVSGECLALLLSARRDSKTATDETLSRETVDLATALGTELDGSSFEDLFDYVYQLEGVAPLVVEQQKIIDAQVYGFLARNASRSSDDSVNQAVSGFLNRSISALQQMAATIPHAKLKEVILNDPYLVWVRQTDEFNEAWSEIYDTDETGESIK